jgi:hypothetical protein
MTEKTNLILNVDYKLDENGNMELTKSFLKSRGHCCQSACKNCPYGYHEKVDPNVPAELQDPWKTLNEQDNETEVVYYDGEIPNE